MHPCLWPSRYEAIENGSSSDFSVLMRSRSFILGVDRVRLSHGIFRHLGTVNASIEWAISFSTSKNTGTCRQGLMGADIASKLKCDEMWGSRYKGLASLFASLFASRSQRMSGIGESLLVEVAAELILKCVLLGVRIVNDARVYSKEGQKYATRLELQIRIWRAIETKVNDSEIRKRIRNEDLVVYFNVMKELHGLFRKFIERKFDGAERVALLNESSSVETLLNQVEDQDIFSKISLREKARSSNFWWRFKEEAAYTVQKGGRDERLVKEIEEWGARLQQLASWTIPPLFPNATPEQVKNHIVDPSGTLSTTNSKGQIIMARTGNSTSINGTEEVGGGPFRLKDGRIRTLKKGVVKLQASGSATVDDTKFTEDVTYQLGGVERRQWANLTDESGKQPTAVIVEFRARPAGNDDQAVEDAKKELDHLVKTLRLAANKPDSFRVMHCEGWYEETNHFGLVYRLPLINCNLRCESLSNILREPKYRDQLSIDLDNRLKLTKALAWTLFELHSVDWVHKSLDPNNILLFGEDVGGIVQFDWSKPYLVGFDSSRMVTGISGHSNFKTKLAPQKLYIHPDRQTNQYVRFEKIHDIYSLGVILLELGKLKSFLDDAEGMQRLLETTSKAFKAYLIGEAKELQAVLGKTFSESVVMCLNGQLVDASQDAVQFLTSEFRSQIIGKLEQIRITVPEIDE